VCEKANDALSVKIEALTKLGQIYMRERLYDESIMSLKKAAGFVVFSLQTCRKLIRKSRSLLENVTGGDMEMLNVLTTLGRVYREAGKTVLVSVVWFWAKRFFCVF
jgi:hypothetical protein